MIAPEGSALLANQRGEVTLGFQSLECPMLDERQRTRSNRLDGLPVWTRALRLSHAGVPTELHVYPGGCHVFQMAPDNPVTQQANGDIDEWLARPIASSASR